MTAYTDQLMALLKQIPDSIEEQDLPQLEQVATEFEHILKLVHHHDARSRANTQFYYERIKHIESALYNAKYGHNQKQRDTSFKKAKEELVSGIEALVQLIKDSTTKAGSK